MSKAIAILALAFVIVFSVLQLPAEFLQGVAARVNGTLSGVQVEPRR